LQAGEPFTPTLKEFTGGKKRKRGGDHGPRKRQHTVADEDDDFDDIDNSGSESDTSDSDPDSDDETSNKARSGNEGGDDDDDMEEVTEESLNEKIQGCKNSIKAIRERHNEARVRRKEASDALSSLEKMNVKMQKEKNAFCSLKRSEVSNYPHIFSCLKPFGSSRVTS